MCKRKWKISLTAGLAAVLVAGCGESPQQSAHELYAQVQGGSQQALDVLLQRVEGERDASAAFFLALLLDPLVNPKAKEQDAAQAIRCYMLARAKHPQASHNLALLVLAGGRTVREPGDTANSSAVSSETAASGGKRLTAVELLQEAADRGHRPSAMLLAVLYRDGATGVTADPARSVALLSKLNEQYGDGWSRLQLGKALARGEGAPRDPSRAIELLSSAAEAGLVEAHVELVRWVEDPVQRAQWALTAALRDPRYEGLATQAVGNLPPGVALPPLMDRARIWAESHRSKASPVHLVEPATTM
jgi:TPR repeat protein